MGFIPYFHFDNPEDKLKPEWCKKATDFLYRSNVNVNLLHKKNVPQIEAYSDGSFSMLPFKMMFKSMKRKLKAARKEPDGTMNADVIDNIDTVGIDWEQVPLIPTKLNSAIATVQKVPIEPTVEAQDGLAMKKREEDIQFLKNKPLLIAELAEIAARLQIGQVDLGTTKNSFKKFSDTPLGLNLNNPDDENIFVKLIYSLTVEAAFEKALVQFNQIKKGNMVKLLEITDQFKYGVSCHRNFTSAMTGLPDLEYTFPGDVSGPESYLPDYSDQTHRIIDVSCTPMELFNYFGDEICDEQTLELIVNGDGGYCSCNGGPARGVDKTNWGSYKMRLKYFEVKSVDWVGVHRDDDGNASFTDDPKCKNKIWAQNTYCFYWLYNTTHFYGIQRLPFTYRSKGNEAYQNFSSNIYRTKRKSAVELCIGENKKAQIADIKLQHALIKSLPSGRYVDLRFLRGAIKGLSDEKNKWTIQDLVDLVMEQNFMIGDTEGFDGRNDGQVKPIVPIPGGLNMDEITGYVQTMVNAAQNVSNYTGINEQLTGESANPEGLVGLQKLLINSSINAIYYITDAINFQEQQKYTNWCSLIEYAVEKGGKIKQAIVDMIGIDDTEIIAGLDEAPLHKLTCKVVTGQREVERAQFEAKLAELNQKGVITTADVYMLSGIENPKERYAILASLEKKAQRQAQEDQQRLFQQQNALAQQKGQQDLQKVQAETQSEVVQIREQGAVDAQLMQLQAQLGLSDAQVQGLIKRVLQDDRNKAQITKAILSQKYKADTQAQVA